MALSSDTPRDFTPNFGVESGLPTQAVTTYAGSAVTSDASGDVGPLATGETFEGFARQQKDNSGGSAGDKKVRVLRFGEVLLTLATSIDDSNIGDAVYASDDDTFTTTSSGNLQIGKISAIEDASNNKARVYFEAAAFRSI